MVTETSINTTNSPDLFLVEGPLVVYSGNIGNKTPGTGHEEVGAQSSLKLSYMESDINPFMPGDLLNRCRSSGPMILSKIILKLIINWKNI